MSDYLCEDPIVYEIRLTITSVKVSNLELHGDIWCHLFVDESDVAGGVREDVETKLDKLRRKKECPAGCTRMSLEIIEGEIFEKRHVHRHHVWDSTSYRGNCRATFDVEVTIKLEVFLGLCVKLDKLEAFAGQIAKDLAKLKKIGKSLEGLTDPDEIWKRIGGISPKALRESPSMEPPRRIRLKKQGTSSEGGAGELPLGGAGSSGNGGIEVPSLEGIHIESGLDQLITAGFVPKLSFAPTGDPSAAGCVLETSPEGGNLASKGAVITVVVGHQPRTLRDIEAVNITFEARLTEVGIPDLETLARATSTDVKVRGVSEHRLSQWIASADWLNHLPVLDGNAVELLVRGLGWQSPVEAREMISNLTDAALKQQINAAGARIKLPKQYIEEHLPMMIKVLRAM